MKPATGRTRGRACRNCLHARVFAAPDGRTMADCRAGRWSAPVSLRRLEKPLPGGPGGQGPDCPAFAEAD